MEFRPCIDIHDGRVKQIVGGSLRGESATENFVADQDAASFATYYRSLGISGGHVILLNAPGSPGYNATRAQALAALAAWPGGLQVGGGITPENASDYLRAGASHVIVTSYLFSDGQFNEARLARMTEAVGPDRLVLDLSCRKGRDGMFYVVTDRWQTFTDTVVTPELIRRLSDSCAEFLIHAADVEGLQRGIQTELVELLADVDDVIITYAGGIGCFADLEALRDASGGRLNITIGSALDLFGGPMPLPEVLARCERD